MKFVPMSEVREERAYIAQLIHRYAGLSPMQSTDEEINKWATLTGIFNILENEDIPPDVFSWLKELARKVAT